MVSATTSDSRSVLIDYNVTTATAVSPLTFGIYRSADNRFDPSDIPVTTVSLDPASQGMPWFDSTGQPVNGPGEHHLTIPLPGGLPINPEHPYVLVVADPTNPIAQTDLRATASFHKDAIAVVTHGGIELKRYSAHGPPWEQIMAASLRKQGYNTVIAYNWVTQSSTPGAAARQGPKLAAMVLSAAGQFPADDPVDLHMIGHSEGTVVNTQALLHLQTEETPQLRAGFLEDTLLDPHAANPDVPGQQYSVTHGWMGWIAKMVIDHYQAQAKDPPVIVPSFVDDAQVFYQHSPASRTSDGIYNLWGQVPVKSFAPTHYFDLTADGVVHSGDNGVANWYEAHVVPTLGDGAPELTSRTLTGSLDSGTVAAESAGSRVSSSRRVTYTGTSAPGSSVRLFVGPASSTNLSLSGQTVTSSDGHWSVTTRLLANGRYRVFAIGAPPPTQTGPRLPAIPTAPLGTLVVSVKPRR
jgi:hypothetical protein